MTPPHPTPRADGIQIIVIYCLRHFCQCWLQPLSDQLNGLHNGGSSAWYGRAWLLLIVMSALENIHFAKAENTYENGGGGCGVFGLFSGVINKVCRKQWDPESLWFTGNGWCLPQGGITTASCLKKYHKDQANPPLPNHSHLEQLRGVHGKWKRLEPNQYRCNSLQLSASSLLLYAVVALSYTPI